MRKRTDASFHGKKIIDLLVNEQTRLLYVPPVNTITFFEGEIPITIIQNRLVEIIQANPWLTSRLSSILEETKPDHSKQIILEYDDPTIHFSPETILTNHIEIQSINNDQLSLNHQPIDEMTSAEDLLERFHPFLIKKGINCLNKPKEILFKIIIIPILQKKSIHRTALIVSMSHVIGDGHTFYTIYSMLSVTSTIRSLNPKRVLNFPQHLTAITGEQLQLLFRSYSLLIGSLIVKFFFRPKKVIYRFRLNVQKIEELKKEYLQSQESTGGGGVNFISTNDLLTSWFFKEGKERVKYGMMPINYRNRLLGCTDNHAGNYQSSILYPRELYQKPQGIRQIIQQYDQRLHQIPTTLEVLFQFPFSIVTNWTTFYKDIHFTATNRLIVHAPLISGKGIALPQALILFRPKEGELGAFIICDADRTEEDWIEKTPFLSTFH